MKTIARVALVSLAMPAPAASSTWYIKPDGTGDVPTIQAAFSIAAHGDTVLLAAGTYHEYDLWIPGR